MALNKVSIIGEQAWHVFADQNGNEIKEDCTLEEYRALSLPYAIQPSKPNHIWRYSYTDWKYNTLSGRLEDGCYAVEPSGRTVFKQKDKQQDSRNDEATFLKEIK